MKLFLTTLLCAIFSMFINSCGDGTPPKRNLSPRDINISGIKLNLTKKEIAKVIPALQCNKRDSISDECTWHLLKEEKKDAFRGIEQIKFDFIAYKLKTVRMFYSEMVDLEYKDLATRIREKYASVATDTLGTEWQYDSVKITLIPNQRRHWTGNIFFYAPVIEFKEEIIPKQTQN